MHFKWKNTFVVVTLFIIAGLLFLGNRVFEDNPAISPTGFIFIFIFYIVFFPLIIPDKRPGLDLWVKQFNRRAPPLS
jgi:hypothetical protein